MFIKYVISSGPKLLSLVLTIVFANITLSTKLKDNPVGTWLSMYWNRVLEAAVSVT